MTMLCKHLTYIGQEAPEDLPPFWRDLVQGCHPWLPPLLVSLCPPRADWNINETRQLEIIINNTYISNYGCQWNKSVITLQTKKWEILIINNIAMIFDRPCSRRQGLSGQYTNFHLSQLGQICNGKTTRALVKSITCACITAKVRLDLKKKNVFGKIETDPKSHGSSNGSRSSAVTFFAFFLIFRTFFFTFLNLDSWNNTNILISSTITMGFKHFSKFAWFSCSEMDWNLCGSLQL